MEGLTKTIPKVERTRQPVQKNIVTLVKRDAAPNVTMEEINGIDLQSRMGRFGWIEDKTDIYYGIPYILRNSIKYFSKRMIFTKPLQRLLRSLNPKIYELHLGVMEYATQAECRLLNEINLFHCDESFGKIDFTTGTLIIKMTDAFELYQFLETCYKRLTGCTDNLSNKIGFIQFSFSDTLTPYFKQKDELYMPLYCFDNANDLKIEYLDGWDSAYLRFCCLYQGIWTASSTIFAVVKLSSLILPIGSHYNYLNWPASDHHQLLRNILPKTVVGKQSVVIWGLLI